jgi:hypothetical protein
VTLEFKTIDVKSLVDRYKKLGAHVDRDGTDVFLQPFAIEESELETAGYATMPARLRTGVSRLEELRDMGKAAGIPETLLRDESEAGKEGFADRLLTFTASDETRDRYGDRILVDGTMTLKDGSVRKFGKGWQLGNFLKNPVFMPFHQYSTIPLGQAIDTYADQKGKRKRLRMTVLMGDGSTNPIAPLILAAYKAREMRAVSVGFMALKAYSPADPDERSELDLGQWGVIFGEQELWENSAVAIPANPNATDEKDVQDPARVAGLLRLADQVAAAGAQEFAYVLRGMLPKGSTSVDVGAVVPAGAVIDIGAGSAPEVIAPVADLVQTLAGTECKAARLHLRQCGSCRDHVIADDGSDKAAPDLAESIASRIMKTLQLGDAGAATRLTAVTEELAQLVKTLRETLTSETHGAPPAPVASPGTPDEDVPSLYEEVLDVQKRIQAALTKDAQP